ncbi:MAG: hypothetical protein ABII09_00845 [Planctomycetota bacterium]
MNRKYYYRLMSIFFIMLYFAMNPSDGWTITIDELIARCKSAENRIRDISMEYEWYQIPPLTHEELEEPFKSIGVILAKDGITKYKLSAGHFVEPNGLPRWKYIFEESVTVISKDGQSWDNFSKYSYDGQVYKKYNLGGWPKTMMHGLISPEEMDTAVPLTTPIGFSIFRFESEPENLPLSITLKQSKDENRIRLIDTVSKMNDFNVIRVDLLSKLNNLPWTHIYFSIDHNYIPVKYEFVKNAKGEISFTIEVHSLEKIGDGLWFPSSGMISAPDDKHVDAFQVIGKILANQGLTEKDFDIEFPVGTRVQDQITNREYTVGEESK